jgi:3-deoxy-manno-octulosonate cytidylyltransferase (CMP-KDO synthetase)
MKSLIVIPARMASTRFPGKPLCDLLGKPMIQWVYERAVASGVGESVIIATPDQEIIDASKSFGAESILTRIDHPSGTDRIAEVSQSLRADVYINVQGDEPLIRPESIRACAEPLLADSSVAMGSVYGECPEEEHDNPAVVKVVTDRQGYALYFSRDAIPFARNARQEPVKKHVGIYAFRYDVLQSFSQWSPTPLEQTESLEQLRFLEHGVRIKMSIGEGSELAVDTPEQAEGVRKILSIER